MQKEKLTYQMLLAKAKKENLTFSNLLGGCVLEEVVRKISGSALKENLWLRNGNVLGIKQYEKNLVLRLEYDYIVKSSKREDMKKSDESLLLELSKFLKEEVFAESTDGVQYNLKMQMFRKYLQIQLQGELEGMQVPILLKIFIQTDEKKVPRKESIPSTIFPDVMISFYSYPMEGFLAEMYMEIITKLELIQTLSPYYQIYHLLEHESVDGRKVKEYVEEQYKELHMTKSKKRLTMISGYKNYTYMKKRWKVYLRSVNCKEPEWEQVIERITRFFDPIWKAVINDEGFIGDWMPELNRFL